MVQIALREKAEGFSRCGFCHGDLDYSSLTRCEACSAPHHLDCWSEGGACSACFHRHCDRESDVRRLGTRPSRRSRREANARRGARAGYDWVHAIFIAEVLLALACVVVGLMEGQAWIFLAYMAQGVALAAYFAFVDPESPPRSRESTESTESIEGTIRPPPSISDRIRIHRASPDPNAVIFGSPIDTYSGGAARSRTDSERQGGERREVEQRRPDFTELGALGPLSPMEIVATTAAPSPSSPLREVVQLPDLASLQEEARFRFAETALAESKGTARGEDALFPLLGTAPSTIGRLPASPAFRRIGGPEQGIDAIPDVAQAAGFVGSSPSAPIAGKVSSLTEPRLNPSQALGAEPSPEHQEELISKVRSEHSTDEFDEEI